MKMSHVPGENPDKIFYCSSTKECWAAAYTGTQICSFLKQNSFELVDTAKKATAVVINTCAFTLKEREHSIGVIKQLQKTYPQKQIVVVGCITDTDAKTHFLRDLILVNPGEISRLNDIFPGRVSVKNVLANRLEKGLFGEEYGHSHFFIRICEGCIFQCSYCAIKLAKGHVRSKKPEQIEDEFRTGLREGYKQFMLWADDCYSYGRDLGANFIELLERILDIPGDYRLGIYNFYPGGLLKDWKRLKPLFASGKISLLLVPMQSGSKKILKAMKRNYDPEKFAKTLPWIKKHVPLVKTHFLVCFPGETRRDFLMSMRYVPVFDEVEILFYSPVPGTPSSRMATKMPPREILWRKNYLYRLQKDLARKNSAKRKRSAKIITILCDS